jgi:hypothetical protein
MSSSWQIESGHLACRWSNIGKRDAYDLSWMEIASGVRGSYLPPIPDFATHSPFGGATWFLRYGTKQDVDLCP